MTLDNRALLFGSPVWGRRGKPADPHRLPRLLGGGGEGRGEEGERYTGDEGSPIHPSMTWSRP